ncbi:hypothetical protein D3C77_685060 [compost metagenome]
MVSNLVRFHTRACKQLTGLAYPQLRHMLQKGETRHLLEQCAEMAGAHVGLQCRLINAQILTIMLIHISERRSNLLSRRFTA